ncbi:MAG: glycosyltransferase, partial [Thermoanaerobaculia bacterium]|nr:glycosyltransferase [Thermoanaerobaculia bacterium]
TLSALAGCETPPNPVEVIIVINNAGNAPDNVKQCNAETYSQTLDWAARQSRPGLKFHPLHFPELPPKHAGVGLARKIAMDEAARRLENAGVPRGVIACLDADSLVQPNYLQALQQYFDRQPGCLAAGIYYEHPLDGDEYAPEIYESIARYELHLRYYVHALRWAGLPTATQTVGSAMAVRAGAYQAQGGMNRRQAGEDFYFLHKFTPLDGFGEITTTTVIPSPRSSHRVPFGTGKAVGDMLAGNTFLTYSPLIFKDLKVFLDKTDRWFDLSGPALLQQNAAALAELDASLQALPRAISSFLEKENFRGRLREIRGNTATPAAFRKRFFRWFDPFLAMKFVHHARDHFYANIPVEDCGLRIADYGLRIADCGLRITDCGSSEEIGAGYTLSRQQVEIKPPAGIRNSIRALLELFRTMDRNRGGFLL